MNDRPIAIYPGRFQPLHNDHLGVVKVILRSFPKHRLTIAVADWKGERGDRTSCPRTGRLAFGRTVGCPKGYSLIADSDQRKNWLTKSEVGYIINHNLDRRLRNLPEGPKRPWGNELDASYPPSGRERV